MAKKNKAPCRYCLTTAHRGLHDRKPWCPHPILLKYFHFPVTNIGAPVETPSLCRFLPLIKKDNKHNLGQAPSLHWPYSTGCFYGKQHADLTLSAVFKCIGAVLQYQTQSAHRQESQYLLIIIRDAQTETVTRRPQTFLLIFVGHCSCTPNNTNIREGVGGREGGRDGGQVRTREREMSERSKSSMREPDKPNF